MANCETRPGVFDGWAQTARLIEPLSAAPALPVPSSTTFASKSHREQTTWSVEWTADCVLVGLGTDVGPGLGPMGGGAGCWGTVQVCWSAGQQGHRVIADANAGRMLVAADHVELRCMTRPDVTEVVLQNNGKPTGAFITGSPSGPVAVTTVRARIQRLDPELMTQASARQRITFTDAAVGADNTLLAPPAARKLDVFEDLAVVGRTWVTLAGAPFVNAMGTWNLGLRVPSIASAFNRTYGGSAVTWAVWSITP